MTQTIIDGETLTGNGEVTGEFTQEDPEFGDGHVVYIEGDGQGTDVTVEFFVEPQDVAGTGTFYHLVEEDVANVDLTSEANNRRAFHTGGALAGAARIRVRVIDNRGSGTDTVVTVKADDHRG